jgi:hypothetical protein
MMMKPHFESFSKSSSNASTWNRESHMYSELASVPVTATDIRVDGLEWRQSKRNLLLLALLVQDSTDKDTKTIVGNTVKEFKFLLRRGNGGKDRQSGRYQH